jgi:hypothetical protein
MLFDWLLTPHVIDFILAEVSQPCERYRSSKEILSEVGDGFGRLCFDIVNLLAT